MNHQPKIAVPILITILIYSLGAWLASSLNQYAHAENSDAVKISKQKTEDKTSAAVTTKPEYLKVNVTGIDEGGGKIVVMVFDDAGAYKSYDYNRAAAYAEKRARPGSREFKFKKLKKGPYAVVVHHDQDGDYEFDMRGDIPLEGYVTSGAESKYDEPSFEQASIASGTIDLDMFYYEAR